MLDSARLSPPFSPSNNSLLTSKECSDIFASMRLNRSKDSCWGNVMLEQINESRNKWDDGNAVDLREAAGPSKFGTFLSCATSALIGAAALAGAAYLSTHYDAYINGDLVETIKQNWSWLRLFGSSHAMTAAYLMHPYIMEGATAVLGAVLGVGHRMLGRE